MDSETYEKIGYTRISSLDHIDYIVENSECTSIIVDNFLNQFFTKDIAGILNKISSKIRINGKITVIENDIDLIANNYTRGFISFDQFNELMFGDTPVRSFTRIEDVHGILTGVGLVVQSKQLRDNVFTVSYKRMADQ